MEIKQEYELNSTPVENCEVKQLNSVPMDTDDLHSFNSINADTECIKSETKCEDLSGMDLSCQNVNIATGPEHKDSCIHDRELQLQSNNATGLIANETAQIESRELPQDQTYIATGPLSKTACIESRTLPQDQVYIAATGQESKTVRIKNRALPQDQSCMATGPARKTARVEYRMHPRDQTYMYIATAPSRKSARIENNMQQQNQSNSSGIGEKDDIPTLFQSREIKTEPVDDMTMDMSCEKVNNSSGNYASCSNGIEGSMNPSDKSNSDEECDLPVSFADWNACRQPGENWSQASDDKQRGTRLSSVTSTGQVKLERPPTPNNTTLASLSTQDIQGVPSCQEMHSSAVAAQQTCQPTKEDTCASLYTNHPQRNDDEFTKLASELLNELKNTRDELKNTREDLKNTREDLKNTQEQLKSLDKRMTCLEDKPQDQSYFQSSAVPSTAPSMVHPIPPLLSYPSNDSGVDAYDPALSQSPSFLNNESFNGHTEFELRRAVMLSDSIKDVIRTLALKMFSEDQLINCSISGKRSVQSGDTPRPPLNLRCLGKLEWLVKDICPDYNRRLFHETLQNFQKVLRRRRKNNSS